MVICVGFLRELMSFIGSFAGYVQGIGKDQNIFLIFPGGQYRRLKSKLLTPKLKGRAFEEA